MLSVKDRERDREKAGQVDLVKTCRHPPDHQQPDKDGILLVDLLVPGLQIHLLRFNSFTTLPWAPIRPVLSGQTVSPVVGQWHCKIPKNITNSGVQ
ncbi:hypothetical protein D4764_19G0002380 [Takifugu flavidus]|uniref:Uncharacterized protein n=1 Tax=Takifugu flavidus TaxID=433684 RepID=A0A5C6NQL8_9TELE|nr:hypothetical protein D4764_19G0002380 [Takifugu flavidus]